MPFLKTPSPLSDGFQAVALGPKPLLEIADDILIRFDSGQDARDRAVFVKLQDEGGLFSENVPVEMLNERIGAAAEIGQVHAVPIWSS